MILPGSPIIDVKKANKLLFWFNILPSRMNGVNPMGEVIIIEAQRGMKSYYHDLYQGGTINEHELMNLPLPLVGTIKAEETKRNIEELAMAFREAEAVLPKKIHPKHQKRNNKFHR